MKTCEYDGDPFDAPRSHPWTTAESNAEYRYYDLKAEPARIRTSLEDLVPWSHWAAIEKIYALIVWLNGPDCVLESNDCAFTGPHPNDILSFAKSLQCSGRIMVLYRSLAENLSRDRIEALKDALHPRWMAIAPAFEWGMIGTTIVPVRFTTLPGNGNAQLGHQLMISFWAWGDGETELSDNLAHVVDALTTGLRLHFGVP